MLQGLITPDLPTIVVNLAGAWLAGAAIGLERSFHGGPPAFVPMRWSASLQRC